MAVIYNAARHGGPGAAQGPMLITSKYQSWCKVCNAVIAIGDRCGWQRGEKGVWCTKCYASVAPTNGTAVPAVTVPPPSPLLVALAAFEEHFLDRGQQSVDVEREWDTYSKCKALMLAPGTKEEGVAALKQALLRIIKLGL